MLYEHSKKLCGGLSLSYIWVELVSAFIVSSLSLTEIVEIVSFWAYVNISPSELVSCQAYCLFLIELACMLSLSLVDLLLVQSKVSHVSTILLHEVVHSWACLHYRACCLSPVVLVSTFLLLSSFTLLAFRLKWRTWPGQELSHSRDEKILIRK